MRGDTRSNGFFFVVYRGGWPERLLLVFLLLLPLFENLSVTDLRAFFDEKRVR